MIGDDFEFFVFAFVAPSRDRLKMTDDEIEEIRLEDVILSGADRDEPL